MDIENEILTFKEAKELLGITSFKLNKLCQDDFPHVNFNGIKLFLRSSVLRWLHEKEQPRKKLAGMGQ